MKKLNNLIKSIWIFILCLTPKGKEKVMYDTALKNMKETHVLTTLERRMLRGEIQYFINSTLKRKKISGHQMGLLIENKFKERINGSGLKYNALTYGVIDTIERRKKRKSSFKIPKSA